MLLLTLALGLAQAQEADAPLNSQLFHPTIDGGRTIWSDDSTRLPNGTATGRLLFSYTNRPFIYQANEGAESVALVSDALQANVLLGYTLGPVRLGADLPVYLYTAGELGDGGAGIGDLALDGKISLIDSAEGFGLAAGGRVLLDTANSDLALGQSNIGGEAFVIADAEVDQWLFTANLGTRFLPAVSLANVQLNDQVFGRVGAAYSIVPEAGVAAEVIGHANINEKISNAASVPIEGMLSGWYRMADPFVVRAGIGTGFTRGIGAPAYRAVFSIGYEPGAELKDTDGDGIVDRDDLCVNEPEDFDGFEDEDGCPDLDNDGDGIPDVDDQCINEPEDHDGYEDEDGCPETATEVDFRIVDLNDNTIEKATAHVLGTGVDETADSEFSLVLEPGVYQIDTVAADYIPAAENFVVPEFEAFDYTQVLQPDAPLGRLRISVRAAGGERIDNAFWFVEGQAPTPVTDAEVFLSPGEYDLQIRAEGYAPTTIPTNIIDDEVARVVAVLDPSRIEVTAAQIRLREKVFFDTNLATIKPESFPLLNEVATTLLDNPDITKIRVEGHTDSRGSDAYNLDLSIRRAASVREYLEQRGVAPERMESAGFGESRPVDTAETPAAWEKNRRVEIFILERAEEGATGGRVAPTPGDTVETEGRMERNPDTAPVDEAPADDSIERKSTGTNEPVDLPRK